MGRDADHLPIYHGPGDPNLSPADVLCRVMDLALTAYNELVGDMIKGNLGYDTYQSWVEFDDRASYSVVEVTPENAASYHVSAAEAGLVVRYDGAVVAGVDSLETAVELIALASGRRVALVPDLDRCGRLWWAETVPGC